MSARTASIPSRARRMLGWYPRSWRERYGEEFAELLVADLSERPRCWRRTLDVAVSGSIARLSAAGLAAGPQLRPEAALAAAGWASAGFVALGTALWSQLIIGWRWSPPDSRAVSVAVLVMSVTSLYLALLAVLSALPVTGAVIRRLREPEARRLWAPLILVTLCAAVLVIGGHHFENSWPGTGGHAWRFQGLIPGGVAGFSWAETVGITSYWAHPAALLAFPRAELAWMAASPAAIAGCAAGMAKIVRRTSLSSRALRYEARLSKAAAGGMVAYLGASSWWVLSGRADANGLFRSGWLDLLLIGLMAISLLLAPGAGRRLGHPAPPQIPA